MFTFMQTEELLKLLLPKYLVEYFNIVKAYDDPADLLHIEFEEKNAILPRI